MALTPFSGETPQRNDRTTFSSRVDAFVTWLLGTFWGELDAALEAFNFNATNSTSTTSLLISVASKTLTVQASKSYVKGMAVTIAYDTDPTQWMRGEVTAYNSGTGSLTVNVRYISDTVGTYATWVISQASIESSVLDSEILLTTGAGGSGHGSTNTYIRLLTTTVLNNGTAFSVVHSATLGTYITINEPGIYSISASDTRAAAAAILGVTKNSADLTSSVAVSANILASVGRTHPVSASASGSRAQFTATDRLNTGDVLRMHDASANDGVGIETRIWVRKIGNV